MLVFKDPILGLVAGIQLSANDMLKLGDWLEMPKYGADGAVIDIGSVSYTHLDVYKRQKLRIPPSPLPDIRCILLSLIRRVFASRIYSGCRTCLLYTSRCV